MGGVYAADTPSHETLLYGDPLLFGVPPVMTMVAEPLLAPQLAAVEEVVADIAVG